MIIVMAGKFEWFRFPETPAKSGKFDLQQSPPFFRQLESESDISVLQERRASPLCKFGAHLDLNIGLRDRR